MELQLTREIHAKVMWQTYMVLALHCQRLNLTIGQVIDRAILEIEAKTPDVAAIFLCEQFAIATASLSEEDVERAFILGIALLLQPLLHGDRSPDDVMEKVIEILGNFSLE